jgi:hypothetical protein
MPPPNNKYFILCRCYILYKRGNLCKGVFIRFTKNRLRHSSAKSCSRSFGFPTRIRSSVLAQCRLNSSSRRPTHSVSSRPFKSRSNVKACACFVGSGAEVLPTLLRFAGRSGAPSIAEGVNIKAGCKMCQNYEWLLQLYNLPGDHWHQSQ